MHTLQSKSQDGDYIHTLQSKSQDGDYMHTLQNKSQDGDYIHTLQSKSQLISLHPLPLLLRNIKTTTTGECKCSNLIVDKQHCIDQLKSKF